MYNVCLYCSSSLPKNPLYAEAAHHFAQVILDREFGLVYGGAGVGIMGLVASHIFSAGGNVVGVIPKLLLSREVSCQELTKKYVVADMRERKAKMMELADAFVIFPGGLGTFDELFEAADLSALGQCPKPIGLLNVNGYYNKLIEFLDLGEAEGFIPHTSRRIILDAATPEELFDKFAVFKAPPVPDWVVKELA